MPITIDGAGTITGLSAGGLPDNSLTTSEFADGAVTSAKLATSVASGVAKAWVNFNGTGTVAIRGSLGVSSITDNLTGNYTVNFTTAMVDANYSVVGMASYADSGGNMATLNIQEGGTFSASAVQVVVQQASGTNYDSSTVSVSVFR